MKDTREYNLPLLISLAGFAVWIVIALATHRKEAWDGSGFAPYFLSMLVINAAAGFARPGKALVGGLASVALQPVAMLLLTREVGSMFPLGLIAFLILGLLFSAAGRLGAVLRRALRPQDK